jgi:hypothetical protein
MLNIAWAAGIYEGEGSTDNPSFSSANSVRVQVSQKDPWLLQQFCDLFGGRLYRARGGRYKGEVHMMWRWQIYGARARGFLLTVFSLLSPRRRQQARKVLVAHAG